MPAQPAPRRLQVASRVLAAIVGGYAFTWGFATLAIAGLVALGVGFHDAETGVLMLALLVYLAVFLWAFAAASLVRVAAVLLGGAVSMTAAALALQQTLLP